MKNKIFKKAVALSMVAAMGVSLAACGSTATSSTTTTDDTSAVAEAEETTTESTSSEPTFTIGFPTAASNTSSMAVINSNREAIAEAAGGQCVTEVFDFTAEGTIDAVQKLIETDGCDAVMVTPVADSVLIPIMNMCEEYGVYWVTSMREITDDDIYAQLCASEYYLGGVCQDNYSLGYAMGKAFAEAGGVYYGFISNAVGDASATACEAGLAAAAEEFGLIYVEGCENRAASQASDVAQAVESWISTYPELDGIIRLTSTATGDVSAVCETLEKLGVAEDMLFFANEADDACLPYLESGTLNGTFYDVLYADAVITAAILINELQGNSIVGDSKEVYVVEYEMCEDYDQLVAYYEYVAPSDPQAVMNDEQYQQNFLLSYNSSLTFDTIWDFANNLKPLDVKALLEEAGRL